jgi:hypothetical protein
MSVREDLYRQFGPKLIEALVMVVKDEINILRTKAGLAVRTDDQIGQAIINKLKNIPNYDWMTPR